MQRHIHWHQIAGDVMPFKPIATPEESSQDDGSRSARARRRLPDLLGLMRRAPALDFDTLMDRIQLASLPVTDEDMACTTHLDHGRLLARQDRWDDLAHLIEHADATRLHTPAGVPATMLLADGARSDLVSAARDAIADEADPDPTGIGTLEDVLADQPRNYACALVVALAHIDIGRAWRAAASPPTGAKHEVRFLAHFRRAEALLAPFDAVNLDAPSLAAAQCALLAARPHPHHRVVDDYTRLIDLDPASPLHMRALGEALLPARHGNYETLEREARHAAARTTEIWGAGGYVWVYFDALTRDPGTLARLDVALFVQGLHDIVSHKNDQHVINQLSAFCGIVMAARTGKVRRAAPNEVKRRRIHDCLDWLLEKHLQELHPVVWSQTLLSPGLTLVPSARRALIDKGQQIALRTIAECFAEEIEDGGSIAFSRSGMYRLPAL